jgi:hypothetical protein
MLVIQGLRGNPRMLFVEMVPRFSGAIGLKMRIIGRTRRTRWQVRAKDARQDARYWGELRRRADSDEVMG